MDEMRTPEQVFSPEAEQWKAVKRAAARCGRTLYDKAKHAEAREALAKALRKEEPGALRYWAKAVMIDHRWNGATGEGARGREPARGGDRRASRAIEVLRQSFGQVDLVCYWPEGVEVHTCGHVAGRVVEHPMADGSVCYGIDWLPGAAPAWASARGVRGHTPEALAGALAAEWEGES